MLALGGASNGAFLNGLAVDGVTGTSSVKAFEGSFAVALSR